MTLAELLATVGPPTVADEVVLDLRVALEDAARAASDGVDADRLPLRVTKDRIARVLQCEHFAVVTAGVHELNEPIVRGRILDRLLHHHVHGGEAPVVGPALAVAEGAFEAERADDVVEWLAEGDARERLAEDAASYVARLNAWGRIDEAWWPRCEERVRLDLAGGAVVCAATVDLALGGRPTERPRVLAEVKSGRFTQEHRDGLFWYAVLSTLRHGMAPAAVIGWSAVDGSGWVQPVTGDVLASAAQRACDALARIGELERGRTPVRSACRACAWCVERTTCDAAAPVDDPDDA